MPGTYTGYPEPQHNRAKGQPWFVDELGKCLAPELAKNLFALEWLDLDLPP